MQSIIHLSPYLSYKCTLILDLCSSHAAEDQVSNPHKKCMKFYIHGSVHRNSMLLRSYKMQQYAGVYLLQNHLHVSGVHLTHHQEYIKL